MKSLTSFIGQRYFENGVSNGFTVKSKNIIKNMDGN